MELKELRSNLVKLKPKYTRQLNAVLKLKSDIIKRNYIYKDISYDKELETLKKKERYLCGICGAMDRLKDQIFRYEEILNKEENTLVKGLGNE